MLDINLTIVEMVKTFGSCMSNDCLSCFTLGLDHNLSVETLPQTEPVISCLPLGGCIQKTGFRRCLLYLETIVYRFMKRANLVGFDC